MRKYQALIAVGLTVLGLSLAGCGTPTSTSEKSATTPGTAGEGAVTPAVGKVDAAKATSVADFGGMEGLIAAAKKEGKLNVIALPRDWANYGAIIDAFKAKYGITVTEQTPNASSKEEIAAAQANKGTDKAPDVFDVGTNVALTETANFAPYKVANWDKIPAENKEPSGLWVNDYTGVMVVGYNQTKYGDITSLDQLTDPKFKGTVALNGKPAEAGAAFNGFMLVNLVNGGTFDNPQPGLDYFKKLNEAKTLNLTDVTPGTIAAGEHGVVFDWSYNMVKVAKDLKAKGVEWKTFLPKEIALGSYYNQAINKDAPNPAAARLWQEFLYSAEAQSMWAEGGAKPVLMSAFADQFSAAAKAAVPNADKLQKPTTEQAEKITAFLKEKWNATIS